MHGVPQAFSSSRDQTSNFCYSNARKQPYSGTPVLTEAHHTNVRLNPHSRFKWDGRFKSDIFTVCRRLFALSWVQRPICGLHQVRICFFQERLFRSRRTIQTSDLIHAATTNGMGGLSQTFARCAAGFLLEAAFNIQFVHSNRFG